MSKRAPRQKKPAKPTAFISGSSTDWWSSLGRAMFSGRALWISLAIAAVTAAIYLPVSHYDFVTLDDPQYVTLNPFVVHGLTWDGVVWAWTSGRAFYWHPLTWMSLMLDVSWFGVNAGAFHVVNVVLHIVNALLLFAVLRQMTGAIGRSAVVAALFAVHPLHVESVAWIAERKDLLSTLFWMLVMWGYVMYAVKPSRGRYLWVLVLFALGLLAKPMLVTLPFVLLLLDVWPLKRIAPHGNTIGAIGSIRAWLPLVQEKLPMMALAIASSVVTFVVQRESGAAAGLDAYPLTHRIGNALVSYALYIVKMFWPVRLAVQYPFVWPLPSLWIAGSAIALVAISLASVFLLPRFRYVAVGWWWYVGTLVPVIGIIQSGGQSHGDHFTYVPLIGLFIIIAWGISDLCARVPRRKTILAAVSVAMVAALSATARVQMSYWENSVTLWRHALAIDNENAIGHNNLGVALADQGHADEAIAHYREALRIDPHYEAAHNDLAVALTEQKQYDEAIVHYKAALSIQPDFAEAHANLGVALSSVGRLDDAIAEVSRALQINPNQAQWHYNLGVFLSQRGRNDDAMRQYQQALAIDPAYRDARTALDELARRVPPPGAGKH